ncbi:fibulin-2-like isoform X2 [Electrophorus electricus]|uniref:fibulin-2-like isoform X2 n=1 Tax=Electrophorus electricus TaxID=8005 RepID=UPI0015CFAD75|nr:fibulin-2-like isoform X2 [Electrophorus electricus]
MIKQTCVKLLVIVWALQLCLPTCLGQRDCTDVDCPVLENCIEEVLEKGDCCVSCVQRGCKCEGYQYYDCISAGFRNGRVPEGKSYLVDFGSTECYCPTGGGRIACHFIPCPDIPSNCIDLSEPTEGCAHCLRIGCVYRSQKYEAGHSFHMDPCQVCHCPNDGGDLMCSTIPECKSTTVKEGILPSDSKENEQNENELHIAKHRVPVHPPTKHHHKLPINSLPLYTENTSEFDENEDSEYLPTAIAMSRTESSIQSFANTSPEAHFPLVDQHANSRKELKESLDTYDTEFREAGEDMSSPTPMVPTTTIQEGQNVTPERALVSENPASQPETSEGRSPQYDQTEKASLIRDGTHTAWADEKPISNVGHPHSEGYSTSYRGMGKDEESTYRQTRLHPISTGHNTVTELQFNPTNTPPVNREEHKSPRQPQTMVSYREESKQDVKDISPKSGDHGVSPGEMVQVCCEAGENWASSRDDCNNMVPPMLDSHSVCWTAQRQCCLGSLRESRCVAGLTAARQGQACADGRSDVCGTDSYKECCRCCALGLRLRVERQNCEAPQGLGYPCRHVIHTCCLGLDGDGWSTIRESDQPHPTTPPKRVSDSGNRRAFSLGGAEDTENLVEEVEEVQEVDECELYAGQLCPQRCINTPGSYTCACFPGYTLQPDGISCVQVMVDEENTLTENEAPTVSPAETPSSAPPGIPGPCEGIGPCEQQCSLVAGRPVCFCFPGFSLLADRRSCEDINECTQGTHSCALGYKCVNTAGSFSCRARARCPEGFSQDTRGQCIDIDECRTVSRLCTTGFSCINTVGSYSCQRKNIMCGRGYHASADGMRCTDVDECQRGVHHCGEDQLCHNLPGTYRCDCHTGYQYDMFRKICVDVNECWRYPGGPCAQTCENTLGSYRCSCSAGFALSTDGKNCEDVNECLVSPCSQECANVYGSFQCYCKQGYQLQEDGRTCEDIDECSQRISHLCAFKCVNVPGSYRCACPEHGYTMSSNGRSCQDIDECGTEAHNCTAGETCYNIQGGHRCLGFSCPHNYRRVADTRCERLSCFNFVECQNTPVRITYYQLSFQTNIIIPAQIFRIAPSPAYSGDMIIVSISKGNEDGYFSARKLNAYTGAIYLHRQVQHPHDFLLDVEMKLWRQGTLTTFLARIYVFITANVL